MARQKVTHNPGIRAAGSRAHAREGADVKLRRPDLSAIAAFPIVRKRFMVPRGFAIGKLGFSINIKGLAKAKGLWRAA
jgi:hypothetical protein